MIDEILSPIALEILRSRPGAYGALVAPRTTPLETGSLLGDIRPDQLLRVPITSPGHASAMLAGLWLWHDGLHECHEIAQRPPEPALAGTLNFWHAIMHRREGDFWNSKYWFGRCRSHPALADMAKLAGPILAGSSDEGLAAQLTRGRWDPEAFVDFVERVHAEATGPAGELAVRLQRLEWRALFDACVRSAVA